MSDTKKYKAVEAFELEGAQVVVGQELELGPVQAEELGAKVEAVVDAEAPESQEDSTPVA